MTLFSSWDLRPRCYRRVLSFDSISQCGHHKRLYYIIMMKKLKGKLGNLDLNFIGLGKYQEEK